MIELIEKLPPDEKAVVIAFAKSRDVAAQPREKTIRYLSDEKLKAIVPGIFDRHEELFRRLSQ
ncbi:MAG: hypothetical protein RLZZ15_2461 [Verrucomicrobiota bacterium]